MSHILIQCDILNIARTMKIRFYETIPNWDTFDNIVLHPLRIQMTGSVVVSLSNRSMRACKSETSIAISELSYIASVVGGEIMDL